MPSAPAGAAEAATGGDLDGHRRGGGATGPPQTAEEAVATARAYAESISDGVIERDRAGNAPVAELARLDASGLLAITVPRSLGGPELGAPALAEVIRTIAAVDPAIAQVPQGHFLFCDVLAVWGTARQQRALFGEVLAGARFGNGLAERGGLHAQDLRTRLHGFPDGGGSGPRLTGRKYHTTGSLTARWIGVSALDDVGRLVLAFVRREAPGLRVGDDWNVMGQRATVSGTATFEDVPADPGLVVRYARAFEVPRGSLAVAQAKAFASDVAAEVTTDLFSLSGASATDEKYDLSRHWRNARARQPRPGGLEVPPRGELHAERRAPAEPRAVVSR
jgi:alkylation response protein AidB-like acyl-CoA dehydrogenase